MSDNKTCLDCENCKLVIQDDDEYKCDFCGLLWGDYDICDLFKAKMQAGRRKDETR